MKTFSVGTKLFCDFAFGGKPRAICLAVDIPGNGKDSKGLIKVRLTETVGAYREGEEIYVTSFVAVPCVMERKLARGEFFRRVSTLYEWVKPERIVWLAAGNIKEENQV